jgi:hypothetical protein
VAPHATGIPIRNAGLRVPSSVILGSILFFSILNLLSHSKNQYPRKNHEE